MSDLSWKFLREFLQKSRQTVFGSDLDPYIAGAIKDHEELQAKLAKAESALEFMAETVDAGRYDGHPEECPAHSDWLMWMKAKEALSEIRGKGE